MNKKGKEEEREKRGKVEARKEGSWTDLTNTNVRFQPPLELLLPKLLGFAYSLDDWICGNHSGYLPLER